MTQFAFSSTSAKVCETDACKKLSRELKMIMDPDVHPCDDFSSYVCGNFEKIFPEGKKWNWFSTFAQMGIEIKNEINQLLENQDFSNPDLPQAKAAMFYKSCLNVGKRNIEANPSITEFVNELTKEEDYKKNLISLLKSGLTSRIFSVNSIQDPRNPEYNILKIGEPNLILPKEILRSPEVYENEKKIERYKTFMGNVLQTTGLCYESKDVIDGIVELHLRLAKGFSIIKEQNEKSTIKQLQNRCKKVPWKLLINGVLEKSNKQLKDDERFYIFSWKYVDVLCSVFQEYLANPTKLKILKMDIQWAAIQSSIPYGSEELMDAEDKLNEECQRNKDLLKKCLKITLDNFPYILGNMHANKTFPVSIKEDIKSMIKTVRTAAVENMLNSTWVDSISKILVLLKLGDMKYHIGYPDSFLSEDKLKKDNENFSFHIDKFMENQINFASVKFTKLMKTIGEKRPDDLEVSFHEVNAYYNYFNIMGFPAGILRYPFYDMDLPININYGGIGTVIGHEMMHGFDTDGVTVSPGKKQNAWLPPKSKEGFNKRVKCITDQYGQYKVYNEYLRPKKTIDNDIADNSGLRMAYTALHLPNEKREKMTLPGLDFTPEQLFFISNARSFCADYTKNAAMENLNNGKHTYYKFRINGPMSNMPEFAEHFNCGKDRVMNPRKKCIVW